MAQIFLVLASFSAMLAVAFGAFGAHALKTRLDAPALAAFETAVQYHFYHSLALLAVGVLALGHTSSLLKASGSLLVLGIVLFSGSLYIMSLTGVRWLGAVTPLGGLCFIAAWACLAAASWKLLG